MAYELPRIINVRGRTITIAHLDLPTAPRTILTADVAASGTTLTVLDNAGFANTNPILIGKLGHEQSEIKKVNGVVTAGTSLTSTGVTFAHSVGTPIVKLLFNQWKIYGNTTNTTVGATLIDTIDIQVDAEHTTYVNSSTEYNYYFVLPYDSLNSVSGDTYSDGVANATSYPENSVGDIINSSLHSCKTAKGGKITDEWLFREINDCLRFLTGKLKRWSTLEVFDYLLGYTARGSFTWSIPTDIEDKNSNKSVLSVRIGNSSLEYKDKKEMEDEMTEVNYTQVRTQAVATDTTLEIDNSYDFADSGSVDVFISGTKYTLTYTGVTRSATAGVLTGIPATGTGSITVTIPVDTYVWQYETEGNPSYYTIYDGRIDIWPLPDASYDNKNVKIDYFSKRTQVNSASDVIESSRYDLVKHWLVWKIRCLNNASGQLDFNDGDYQMFNIILVDTVRRESNGQKWKTIPKINTISY